MHIRNLLLVLVGLAGCVTNPDPRSPTIEQTQRTSYGGWIVIHTRHGDQAGELIAVEDVAVDVLTSAQLVRVLRDEVVTAELYEYESEGGLGGWGTVGTLTTLSHGFFLIFSVPMWVTTASITAALESRHVILQIPDDRWDQLAAWARFPQGLPLGVDQSVLVQHRKLPPPVDPVVELARRRDQAWAATKQAREAARANDCATTLQLGDKVKSLDTEMWSDVFMRDAAIARCFAAAPPPP